MIIKGTNLKMYYNVFNKSGSYFQNLKELQEEKYGYELEEGNTVSCVRYDGKLVNKEMYIDPTVVAVNEKGLIVSNDLLGKCKNKFLPWEKEGCNLYVEPCDELYEKVTLKSILDDFKENSLNTEGIWYKHGGWRTSSSFQENLKNFVELGQKSFL